MSKGIAIRVTTATDVWTAVKALRQVFDLPLVAAKSAVQAHTPVPLAAPWTRRLTDAWMTQALILDEVGRHLEEVTALLDRLSAAGVRAEILVDDEPFDRDRLTSAVTATRADRLACWYRGHPDGDLLRIADGGQPATEIERELARRELGLRLHEADARELVWCADSVHAPQLRRDLARCELARRALDVAALRRAAGPCPHTAWRPVGDRFHACGCCSVGESHDWKMSTDARGYGHGCSRCGYFEPD